MQGKLFLVMVLMLPILAQAEIYKWKDSNGVVRYSDTPPASNVPTESLRTRKVINTPAPAVAAKPAISPEAAAIKRQEDAENSKRDEQKKEAEKKVKAQNCFAAKDTLQSYEQGALVYKTNEKGERVYTEDADRPAAIEAAKKDVAKYCN